MSVYSQAVQSLFPKSKTGSLVSYFIKFLLSKPEDEYWSQPEAIAFINAQVLSDGGVGWNTKKGAKTNSKSEPLPFGDPGRELETIRNEKYENCFDYLTSSREGPFRLNPEKVRMYMGSTKSHTFSAEDVRLLKKRADGACEFCRQKGRMEIDHTVPRKHGGLSEFSNAMVLCDRCNDQKCAKSADTFMTDRLRTMARYAKTSGMSRDTVEEMINAFRQEYMEHVAVDKATLKKRSK